MHDNIKLLLVGGMSRSGTTLMSSVFSAHRDIVAGAELIPSPISSLEIFREKIITSLEISDDYSLAGRRIGKTGEKVLGGIVTRFYRAGITGEELLAVVDEYLANKSKVIQSPLERFSFAVNGMALRMERENKEWGSFKLNMPSMKAIMDKYTRTHVCFLVRHPADVMHSQLSKGFAQKADSVAKVWENYIRNALIAQTAYPERFSIVKYENIAKSPQQTLMQIFEKVPLDMDNEMLSFENKDSHIFNSRHPNTEQLKKGFVTDSIGTGCVGQDPEIKTVFDKIDANYLDLFDYRL